MTDYYVLHSGGLDSTTAVTLATQRDDARNVYSIGINYGQRHIKELEAAERTARTLNTTRITLDLTGYGRSVNSALTNPNIPVPRGDYDEDGMADTVVPGRNAVFLSATAGLARSVSGDHPATLVIAVHSGDHYVYPDCREEFIRHQSEALRLAYGTPVEAPFVDKSKADITRTGFAIGAPLGDTWSCYEGGDLHCGECGTCRERQEAFNIAGVEDPTEYEE